MKKKKYPKKLNLNKATISNLDNREMKVAAGIGHTKWTDCQVTCYSCFTDCHQYTCDGTCYNTCSCWPPCPN